MKIDWMKSDRQLAQELALPRMRIASWRQTALNQPPSPYVTYVRDVPEFPEGLCREEGCMHTEMHLQHDDVIYTALRPVSTTKVIREAVYRALTRFPRPLSPIFHDVENDYGTLHVRSVSRALKHLVANGVAYSGVDTDSSRVPLYWK